MVVPLVLLPISENGAGPLPISYQKEKAQSHTLQTTVKVLTWGVDYTKKHHNFVSAFLHKESVYYFLERRNKEEQKENTFMELQHGNKYSYMPMQVQKVHVMNNDITKSSQ